MRQEPIASQAALPDAYRSPASELTLSRTQVRMFAIAMMGGALEYYEFIVFGFMVPTLSQVFFSNASEPWLSTLQTLAVFAVGYLVRPIGGIFLSALGDRLGRKRTFVISLILMATPTMLIGLLPTYAQIGILAPLLLLACRICQGLAMGAEIPSALTFVVEHAPERRTGFAIGLMGSGLTIGLLLGISAVGALSLGFSQVDVAEYAWRIPFILGGLLGLLSAVLRKYAHETPVFAQMAARKSLNKAMPIREVLTKARPELLIALLASFISNSIVQTAVLFPSTFLQSELHLPAAVVHNAQAGLIAVSVFSITLGGWLMDRIRLDEVHLVCRSRFDCSVDQSLCRADAGEHILQHGAARHSLRNHDHAEQSLSQGVSGGDPDYGNRGLAQHRYCGRRRGAAYPDGIPDAHPTGDHHPGPRGARTHGGCHYAYCCPQPQAFGVSGVRGAGWGECRGRAPTPRANAALFAEYRRMRTRRRRWRKADDWIFRIAFGHQGARSQDRFHQALCHADDGRPRRRCHQGGGARKSAAGVPRMNFNFSDDQLAIRNAVEAICSDFGADYWLERDRDGRWPSEFCDAVARGGWFGVTMPEEHGGAGLGISAAAMVMRTIGKLGAAAVSSVHLNLFGPQPVVVFGTEEQKRRMLPPLINGSDRACFGVTEPNVGSDTTRLRTFARRVGDRYIVNGQKVWTSTAQHANKILLVARTTPIEECARPIDGVTLFYTDLDRSHVRISEIRKMARKAVDSNELFIDGLEIPVEDRIGEEGRGFKYLLHGLNPERILVAAAALGGAETALARATAYAKERVVFGRPIGKNQAIQHPLAECWVRLEAAELLMWKAAALYDAGEPCGIEATAAKYLAAEASFETALRAVRTHGGFGFAKEYHVERGLRESVLSLLAPVTQELALCYVAEQALGLPKSY